MSRRSSKSTVRVFTTGEQWKPVSPAAKRNVARLTAILCECDGWIRSAIEEGIFEDIDGSTFCDPKIPNPLHCAEITATCTAVENIRPHASLLHYFGDGLLCFPFDATFNAEIRYPISKRDYAGLPGARKRRAALTGKGKSAGICAEACRLQLKALAVIELDAAGQKRISDPRSSLDDLQATIQANEILVAVRTMRIVAFVDRFLKK